MQSFVVDADLSCPVGEGQRLLSERVPSVSQSVIGLLDRSRPPAVGRFVVTHRVDTIKCLAYRLFTYVVEKCAEVFPPLAYGYVGIIRVIANPAPHVPPALVGV
jgi:hypothetical protein